MVYGFKRFSLYGCGLGWGCGWLLLLEDYVGQEADESEDGLE